MIITVFFDDNGEQIFNGEADVFLEANDYDSEITEILNELENEPYGSTAVIYGNQTDTYTVIKEREEDLWD